MTDSPAINVGPAPVADTVLIAGHVDHEPCCLALGTESCACSSVMTIRPIVQLTAQFSSERLAEVGAVVRLAHARWHRAGKPAPRRNRFDQASEKL